jgi:predicted DNA-binding transcriptional regulator AlpA
MDEVMREEFARKRVAGINAVDQRIARAAWRSSRMRPYKATDYTYDRNSQGHPKMSQQVSQLLNQTAFLREKQLIGDKRLSTPGILPFSHATLWRMVAEGRFPRPLKLTERTTAWRTEEVRRWIGDPSGYRQAAASS